MELKEKSVLIIGAGTLGCFVIEEFARIGVKKIYVVDDEEFEFSDMPHQLYATFSSIGANKATTASERVREISDVEIVAVREFFTEENAGLISRVDIVLECVNDLELRTFIATECRRRGVAFVHAATEGDKGELFLSTPDSDKFLVLMEGARAETSPTNVHTAGVIASMQVALALKHLTGEDEKYRNHIIAVELDSFAVSLIEV